MGQLFLLRCGTIIFHHWFCAAQVGEGSFGRVLACVDESKKLAVAVKVVKGPAVVALDVHARCRSMVGLVGHFWVIC